jgi:hypothetical protein
MTGRKISKIFVHTLQGNNVTSIHFQVTESVMPSGNAGDLEKFRIQVSTLYAVSQLIIIKLFLPPNCLESADSGESSDK